MRALFFEEKIFSGLKLELKSSFFIEPFVYFKIPLIRSAINRFSLSSATMLVILLAWPFKLCCVIFLFGTTINPFPNVPKNSSPYIPLLISEIKISLKYWF